MKAQVTAILFPCLLMILCLVYPAYPLSGPGTSAEREVMDAIPQEPGLGSDNRELIYESDWFEMDLDSYRVLTHGLGGDPGEYLVFMYGKNFYGRHQCNYGIVEKDQRWFGVEWLELNPNAITLYRCEHDAQAGEAKWWEFIKVIIIRADCLGADRPCSENAISVWNRDGTRRTSIPVLDFYDSEWFAIHPEECLLKTHDLGGDPGEYLVFVYGRNGYGIHQARYGMAEASGSWIGLKWVELNSSTMRICRAPDDDISGQFGPWDEARIRIIKTDVEQIDPHYDSGWFGIDADEDVDLYHNLGGDPGRYLVFLYGKNAYGIHHSHYGTLEARISVLSRWFGGEWYQLNEDRITIRRAADDDQFIDERGRWEQARVIIIGELWDPCAVDGESEEIAEKAQLANLANPFTGRAAVRFFLPGKTWAEITVYDAAGRQVRTLLNGVLERGWYEKGWDGNDTHGRAVAAGSYFVQLRTERQEDVRGIVVIR